MNSQLLPLRSRGATNDGAQHGQQVEDIIAFARFHLTWCLPQGIVQPMPVHKQGQYMSLPVATRLQKASVTEILITVVKVLQTSAYAPTKQHQGHMQRASDRADHSRGPWTRTTAPPHMYWLPCVSAHQLVFQMSLRAGEGVTRHNKTGHDKCERCWTWLYQCTRNTASTCSNPHQFCACSALCARTFQDMNKTDK